MKGFVLTPPATVDTMVQLLFRDRWPARSSTLLDPGCGTGEFIDGVIRWCERQQISPPRIVGIESDPRHMPVLLAKYERVRAVRIRHADFLTRSRAKFDYIVGNPPYVPITALSEDEKMRYRSRYGTAQGRFDLYMLFFEQALRNLAPGGRLVFITPEKYLYVQAAKPLRNLLARFHVEEIRLVPEDTFGELVTYPTITVIGHGAPGETNMLRRDGKTITVDRLPGRDPWFPLLEGAVVKYGGLTLGDLCTRISCGVATGADSQFVRAVEDLEPMLRCFGYPTVAGRELNPCTAELPRRFVMLIPYDVNGRLLPLQELGALACYLQRDGVRSRLLARTCVKHKPWYAFHETPPLREILRPKILCKDIGEKPQFWIDRSGDIVPRHSVYYIVPREPAAIDVIATYLRSQPAHEWLTQNCQRAAKGFLRLQSRTLQRLPVPDDVADAASSDHVLPRQSVRFAGNFAFRRGSHDEHAI